MQIHFFQENNYKSITQYCWRSDFCSHECDNSSGRFSKLVRSFSRNRQATQDEVIWDHQPNPSVTNDREKKRKAFVEVPAKRRFSERGMNNANPRKVYWRARLTSSPCATISEINSDIPDNLQRDSRFTEAAKKLSKEEMALLYEDIVKPLDVYSILTEKRREMRHHKWTLLLFLRSALNYFLPIWYFLWVSSTVLFRRAFSIKSALFARKRGHI